MIEAFMYFVPIGIITTIILTLVSVHYAQKFSFAVDDEEKARFSKPFHFRFWLSLLIFSIIFLAAFSVLGFKISALLKA